MSENVKDATYKILIKIQEQLADQSARLERIEEICRKQRRDAAGMLVMMKATAGDFDERVTVVEQRMDAMDARRS